MFPAHRTSCLRLAGGFCPESACTSGYFTLDGLRANPPKCSLPDELRANSPHVYFIGWFESKVTDAVFFCTSDHSVMWSIIFLLFDWALCLTPGQRIEIFSFECVTLVMRSAPSVENCIIWMFFLDISDAVFLSHRLNPLNTTGVNSRCCLSCTCAHMSACAKRGSHLLQFTVRRAPLS